MSGKIQNNVILQKPEFRHRGVHGHILGVIRSSERCQSWGPRCQVLINHLQRSSAWFCRLVVKPCLTLLYGSSVRQDFHDTTLRFCFCFSVLFLRHDGTQETISAVPGNTCDVCSFPNRFSSQEWAYWVLPLRMCHVPVSFFLACSVNNSFGWRLCMEQV